MNKSNYRTKTDNLIREMISACIRARRIRSETAHRRLDRARGKLWGHIADMMQNTDQAMKDYEVTDATE